MPTYEFFSNSSDAFPKMNSWFLFKDFICSVVVISNEPEFTPKLPEDEIVEDEEKELYDENLGRKSVHNILTPKWRKIFLFLQPEFLK